VIVEQLTLDTIRRIAEEVAREHAPPLRVVGTVLTSSGSQYIEIVLRIEGCHQEPCLLSLGIIRNTDVEGLRTLIEEQLRRHTAKS
jgi:hypothetical protein